MHSSWHQWERTSFRLPWLFDNLSCVHCIRFSYIFPIFILEYLHIIHFRALWLLKILINSLFFVSQIYFIQSVILKSLLCLLQCRGHKFFWSQMCQIFILSFKNLLAPEFSKHSSNLCNILAVLLASFALWSSGHLSFWIQRERGQAQWSPWHRWPADPPCLDLLASASDISFFCSLSLLPSRQIPPKPFSFFKFFDNSCTFVFPCKLSSDFVQFQVTCIWGWRCAEYTFTHGGLASSQRRCPRWGHRVVFFGGGEGAWNDFRKGAWSQGSRGCGPGVIASLSCIQRGREGPQNPRSGELRERQHSAVSQRLSVPEVLA